MKKLALLFAAAGLICAAVCCLYLYRSAPAAAAGFSILHDELNRLAQNQTSDIEHRLIFQTKTPVSGGAGSNRIIFSFPDNDDGKWCSTAGADLTIVGCTDHGSTALPGTLAGQCAQGAGASDYDTIIITGVDDLSSITKYCVDIAGGTAAQLGTPAASTSGRITAKTNDGAADIDSEILVVDILADDSMVIAAVVAVCGDGMIHGDEVCDGGSQVCVSGGYSGAQTCNATCDGWNSCVLSESCGDEIVNGPEVCDANSQLCVVGGYSGAQACNATCDGWQTCQSNTWCGDGVVSGSEQCDGGANCTNDCNLINPGGRITGDFIRPPITTVEDSDWTRFIKKIIKTTEPAPEKETECDNYADLNCDGRVDIIDISILLYWFDKPNVSPKVDLNADGRTDMTDLSILVYYWTN